MHLCKQLLLHACPARNALTTARHVKYTIPPALVLTLLYRPLLTRLDVYKILFLITV